MLEQCLVLLHPRLCHQDHSTNFFKISATAVILISFVFADVWYQGGIFRKFIISQFIPHQDYVVRIYHPQYYTVKVYIPQVYVRGIYSQGLTWLYYKNLHPL